MKDFLQKIKVIDHLTTELDIQKSEFIRKFREDVDEGSAGMFSDPFEVFRSGRNEYKGRIDENGFEIRRRRKFFDMNATFAKATGTFDLQGGRLVIASEINGFNGYFFFFYGFLLVFYTIFLISFFFIGNKDNGISFIFFPFILLHAMFMFGIPYFMMRRGVSRLKHDLEREFYYMTKK